MRKQPGIIVTGAAGFIGSAIAWGLNRLGREDLLLVDRLGVSAKWRNLAGLKYLDYMERGPFLERVLGGWAGDSIEAVIHMGACSATTESDCSYLVENNFGYSQALARWCLDRPRPIRFIYASSAATYGGGERGYADDEAGLGDLRPLNMYGYSKQMFDMWCRGQGILDQVAGLKFFNVYGPNEYHKADMRSMVVKAYEQIAAKGSVQLFRSHRPEYKDGEQVRDFVYVKDAVEMALFFLDPGRPGGIYNVGTGRARSWKDMMHAIFACLGKPPQIDYIPMPEILRDKYQYHTQAEMGKLRAAGYTLPMLTLEEGVADYVEYLEAGKRTLG